MLYVTVIDKTSFTEILKYKIFSLNLINNSLLRLQTLVSVGLLISLIQILMQVHSNIWRLKFYLRNKKVTVPLLMFGLAELFFIIWFLEFYHSMEHQHLTLFMPFVRESMFFQSSHLYLKNVKV